MLNVLSKGLKVKQFNTFTDWDIEENLNLFFENNPNLSIIKIEHLKNICYVYYKEFKS